VDVGQHGGVEVHPAQPLEALSRPQKLGTFGVGSDDGSVERPPAEVVDGHDGAGFHPPSAYVLDGGCGRLGDELRIADPGQPGRLLELVELELTPRRRMREGHGLRGSALALGGDGHHVGEEVSGQRLGAVRGAAQDERCGVAEPPLELAGRGRRLSGGAPGSCLAGDDLLGADGHDRRNGPAVRAEGQRLREPLVLHRGRCPRRAQVDSESVSHPHSSPGTPVVVEDGSSLRRPMALVAGNLPGCDPGCDPGRAPGPT
jgi:hypothetical protein